MPQLFGRKLGPDPRLATTPRYTAPLTRLAQSNVSYESLFPPITDQIFNDCVAESGAAIQSAYLKKRLEDASMPSRAALYAQLKTDNASGSEDMTDDGAFPTDALEVMRTHGQVPETVWPYDQAHILTPPPPGDWVSTLLLAGYRVVAPDTDSMRIALDAHGPLYVGWTWPNDWMTPLSDNSLSADPDMTQIAGGHQTTIVGYSDTKGAFRMRNSWGTSWGDNGYVWIPYMTGNRPQDVFVVDFP